MHLPMIPHPILLPKWGMEMEKIRSQGRKRPCLSSEKHLKLVAMILARAVVAKSLSAAVDDGIGHRKN